MSAGAVQAVVEAGGAEVSRVMARVEARMNELAAEADRRVGHNAPLAPAVAAAPMGLAGRGRR